MYKYNCLNPIAGVGLNLFSGDYTKVDDLKDADAALVRSAAMHDLELPESLLAVARAGAGVNNIPTGVWIIRMMKILQSLQRSRKRILQVLRFPERSSESLVLAQSVCLLPMRLPIWEWRFMVTILIFP